MLSEKKVPQVNLVIPHGVNRLISVGELRAVAIKHLVELSVEHEFFATFFLREKLFMCNLKIICAAPHHRVTIYEVSA